MQDISDHELTLLMQRYYNSETAGINYVAMDKDLQALIEESFQDSTYLGSARSTCSGRPTPRSLCKGGNTYRLQQSQDHCQSDADLVARLKAEVAARRLRLHGSFQEVDRLRRGAVTMGQARTVFTILRIELDAKELETLQRIYDANGLFNYREFCNHILEVPLDAKLEDISPISATEGPPYLKRHERVRNRHPLQPDAEELLAEAELWIARRAEHRTINVKSHFLDFDKLRCSRVTRSLGRVFVGEVEVMVLIEGRRREPALQPQPGQKRAAEDAAQAAAKQPRTDAPNLACAADVLHLVEAGGAPAPNPAPAAPAANASSPQAAAVIAALVAAQQQAPGAAQSPQLAAITAAIAAARQAAPAPGAAPQLGGLAATPGLPTQPGAMPPVAGLGQTVPVASAALAPGQLTAPAPAPTALPASTALPPTGLPTPAIPGVATAPPAPTVPTAPAPIQTAAALPTAPGIPTAPTVAPAPVAPPPNPQAAAILSQLAGGATGAPATSQSAVLAALAAQNAGAQPAAPAAPPNPQAVALLQALAGGALGGAQTGAPAAPAAAPAAPTSTLTPQAAAVIAALVARQQQQASQAPGIQPSLALAPQAAPAPPSGSGQIDLFAHLAASARINAAMNAAYAPAEEEQLAEVVPEPAAFDKDALARLAQRAAEGPIEDEPPPPPPPEHKKPVEDLALALAPVDAGAVAAVDVPMEVEVGDAGIAGPDIQQDAEMNGMLQLPAPEVEVKKKDSSSIATMLSYAQSNVAKGKVPSDKAVDTASLQQAFTIGGGASGHTSFSMKGLSPLDSLVHRLDSAGVDLPSEDRKDLQQQITSLLPKLDPAKTADLVSKLQGADGLRSSAFLDEIAKMLPASRFASPHLTRILATLATWAAAVSGSDADGKPKLSEDARSLMDVAPKDLSQIASAMATIGQTEERFFASLARASVARAERFAVEDILLLCMAFDKAGLVHVPLLEAAAKLLRHQVSQVSGPDLAKGLKGLATCCVRDLELGKAVGEYLAEGPKGGLTSEEFCSLAWTFVTLGFYHDQMFRAVFKALEDAPSMPGDTLCQLYEIHLALKATLDAERGSGGGSGSETCDEAFRDDLYGKYELEDAAVQSLKAHYRKQRSGRSVNLATAMFQLLCATVLLCLCNADQPQGPTEARKAIALLAAASAREAQLDEVDQIFLQRMHRCHGVECDNLKVEYEASRKSLEKLEQETLHEATATLESKVPQQPSSSPDANLHKFVFVASMVGLLIAVFLLGRWLHQGRLGKLPSERTPILRAFADIADSLQKVVTGSVSRQHQTELGMAVDIAVTKKGSKPIVFIEVDGSHSLMRTLDLTGPSNQISRVRGPVLLKRYLLQKHGFRIAVVPEDFWRSLPDSREKRDFLRELLRSAGVPSKLFLRIMDMLQMGLHECHLQVLMEAYCDASGREFSYLDLCNSLQRRAVELGKTMASWRRKTPEPSKYFTRKGKVIPLARQAPLSARCNRPMTR
eukprot:symbB.v1.2.030691.t2/scaffold3488.1/size55655/5